MMLSDVALCLQIVNSRPVKGLNPWLEKSVRAQCGVLTKAKPLMGAHSLVSANDAVAVAVENAYK